MRDGMTVAPAGPLAGFTVVDVCRAGPGQWATGILADYGADVVSIVEPGHAQRRAAGGATLPGVGQVNQRNKRSMQLNLRAAEGRAVFLRLVAGVDAVLESNRPGVAARLGIDYEAVRQVNPAIVYCSLSGWGQSGPYAHIPAHDLSYQAVSGMLPQDARGRPVVPTYNHADLYAARYAVEGLLMALLERTRSGQGQYIDLAFCDAAVMIPPGRHEDEMLCGRYPCYNVYETADGGYVTLSIREPWFWERVCRLVERPEWAGDLRPEGALRAEQFAHLRATFRSRSLAEWRAILTERDIEFGAVNRTTAELAADPHIRAREMVIEVTNPLTGAIQAEPGFALKFSRTPAALRHGPTLMGADTVSILRELGYGGEQIAALRESGAIGEP